MAYSLQDAVSPHKTNSRHTEKPICQSGFSGLMLCRFKIILGPYVFSQGGFSKVQYRTWNPGLNPPSPTYIHLPTRRNPAKPVHLFILIYIILIYKQLQMNILDSFRYSVFTLSNLLKCQQISRNRMASSVFPGKSKAYFQKSKVYFSESKLYFFKSVLIFYF